MSDKRQTQEKFVARYGAIYEHSPWVAERVFVLLDGNDVSQQRLAKLMADVVDNAAESEQLALIRAHPDLAGKAAVLGELTADSSLEQSKAGLDQCSQQEFDTLQTLNTTYKERFGIPFIMAVRNSTREQIIAAFTTRMTNSAAMEFEMALKEIHQIAALRLAAMESES